MTGVQTCALPISRGITNSQHSDSTNSARINLFKSRGTNASPTIIQTGDVLGFISFGGYDGSSYLEMAGIRAVSTGTIATTRVPTQLQFYTATDAAPSVITVALTIGADQNATFVGSVTATSFSGSGASLTNLNASNLASGTVPTARLGSGTANSSTFLRGDNTWAAPPSAPVSSVFGRTGAVVAQTGDYGFSQISGSVADGQLSPNVTLLGNTTTGTGAIVRATSPTLVTPTLGVATATTLTSPANSPAQITANQNNYAVGVGLFNRVNSDASRIITGIVAGVDGQLALDWNVGSFDLVYSQQDTNSTAANRFANASGANLTISAGQVALRQYDNTTARWRAVLLGNKTSLTAGDYWVPGMAIPATIGNSALVASTNQVRVVRVFLDQSIQQDRIAINGVTNGAGGKASFGVYSNDGNTLLYYSGLVSTDLASPWSGAQTITLSTGGTIGPGYFLFAWTADNTSATARSFTLDSNLPAVLNQGSFFVGTAANAATGGALPATLGTLTSSNSITSIPIGKFFKS